MNKIEREDKIVKINQNLEKTLDIFLEKDTKMVYEVLENSSLRLYIYSINKSNSLEVHLNGNNATVELHYSTINYDSNMCNVDIYHNYSNTKSNIYNHGLNVFNKKLNFNINGHVLKESDNCICNQENQIINLKDGDSIIRPNLFIDNYNVVSSHSAYIGKFREDELFYLMSRGLSRNKSYDLLIKSFLTNSLENESESLNRFIKEIEKI